MINCKSNNDPCYRFSVLSKYQNTSMHYCQEYHRTYEQWECMVSVYINNKTFGWNEVKNFLITKNLNSSNNVNTYTINFNIAIFFYFRWKMMNVIEMILKPQSNLEMINKVRYFYEWMHATLWKICDLCQAKVQVLNAS